MKPHADAPVVDGLVDSEPDTHLGEPDSHLDSDVDVTVAGGPALSGVPAPRSEALPRTEALPAGLAPAASADPPLTDRERAILAFEQRWWKYAGAKEQAIRDTFDLSATRYYQLLNGLLDNPAALAAEPMVVGRLRRLRSSRARTRRR
jgi:hypothetical protein